MNHPLYGLVGKTVTLSLIFTLAFPVSIFANQNQPVVTAAEESLVPATIDMNYLFSLPNVSTEDLMKVTQAVAPGFMSTEYLEEFKGNFDASVSYLADEDQARKVAFSMYQQWLYLESFKVFRLQYLVANFSKILLLKDGMTPRKAEEEFEKAFPEVLFADYSVLAKERVNYLKKLKEDVANRQLVKDTQDYIKGSLVSAYLSMLVIDKKRENLRARYNKSDSENFVPEIAKLDSWESIIWNSSALLTAKSFKEGVTPFYRSKLANTQRLQESAINGFRGKFQKFIEKNGKLESFADYVTGKPFVEFGKDLTTALELAPSIDFQQKVSNAFPSAVDEVYENLKVVISKNTEEFLSFDTANEIAFIHTQSKSQSRTLDQWLVKVFAEGELHTVIAEEFPYLAGAQDELKAFRDRELKREYGARWKTYLLIAATTIFSPVGRRESFLSKLGKWKVRFVKFGLLAWELYLGKRVILDTYAQYRRFKDMQRISRLNTDGMSLATLTQEQAASTSYYIQAGIVGAGVVMTGLRLLWKPSGHSMSFYLKSVKSSARSLGRSIKAWEAKPVALDSLKMVKRMSGFFSQLIVRTPPATATAVSSFVKKMPHKLWDALIFGSMLIILNLTAQDFIKAFLLTKLVDAFEIMGVPVPVHWRRGALTSHELFARSWELGTTYELRSAKAMITMMDNFLEEIREDLEQDGLSPDLISKKKQRLEAFEERIEEQMLLQLVRWYKRTDERGVANEVFPKEGFIVEASPNEDKPVTLTLRLKLYSGKEFTVTSSAFELDQLALHLGPQAIGMGSGEEKHKKPPVTNLIMGGAY